MQSRDQISGVQSSSKQAGLDWLRAAAALAVVVLHASMPYLSFEFPGTIWVVDSREKNEFVTVIAWAINSSVMPLFFLMSGYLAAQQFVRDEANAVLKKRLNRLIKPTLLGWIGVMPFMLYTWAIGFKLVQDLPWRRVQALKFEPEWNYRLWGSGHLWYLSVLLVFTVGAWLFVRVRSAIRSGHQNSVLNLVPSLMRALCQNVNVVLLVFSLIGGTFLFFESRVLIGFRHEWVPYWQCLGFYSVPFILGWNWRNVDRLQFYTFSSQIMSVVAIVVLSSGLWFQLPVFLNEETSSLYRWCFSVAFCLLGLMVAVFLFHQAMRVTTQQVPAWVQYLASASLWIYLVHPLFEGMVSVALEFVRWPAMIKFSIVLFSGVTISLLTYEFLVRRTWLNHFVDGKSPRQIRVERMVGPAVFEGACEPVTNASGYQQAS